MATLHVNPLGVDTNPGTVLQPVKTLSRAHFLAGNGDTINVEDGRYSEALTLARSNLTIQAAGSGAVLDGGGSLGRAFFTNDSGVTGAHIKGLEITNYTDDAVYLETDHGVSAGHVVENCHIHHISGTADRQYGIFFAKGDSQAIGNRIHHIGPGSESTGIFFSSCHGAAKSDGNVVYAVRKEGIRDYRCLSVQHVNNRVFLCWTGIAPNDTIGTLVANNACYLNTIGINPKHTNSPDSGVLTEWGLTSGTTPADVRVWHNTCWANSWADVAIAVNSPTADQLDIENNIFASDAGLRGNSYVWDSASARTSDLTLDYNVYSTVAPPDYAYLNASFDGFTNGKSFAEMQTAGFEAHGRQIDPQLNDPAAGDFDYPNSSPAASGGAVLASPWGSQVGARGLPAPPVKWTARALTHVDNSVPGTGYPHDTGPNAVDGTLFRYWITASPTNQWIVLDMGSTQAFNHLVVDNYSHQQTFNPKTVRLETAPSASGPWTSVLDTVLGDSAGSSFKLETGERTTRYLRFWAFDNWGDTLKTVIGDLRVGELANTTTNGDFLDLVMLGGSMVKL